jgi:SAM-dependent methyltransferase
VGNTLYAAGLGPAVLRLRLRLAALARDGWGTAPDGLPLPPARLRVLVDGGGDPARFAEDGRVAADAIVRALGVAGVELASLGPVLDFGCGCGRVARHWAALRGVELHGCDRNRELAEWCAENLGHVETRVNGPAPPLPYEDGRFGLVYAISVFTHLAEPEASAWLEELVRVLHPGGYLLLTTHGRLYEAELSASERAAFDRGEPVVQRPRMAGTNACSTFHPRAYMERRLARHFEAVRFLGDGASLPFIQDVYLAGPKPA